LVKNKFTPEQKRAIELEKDLGVVAGAGSGKTMVLVERLMRLLQSGNADFSNIVAITFTNKAAAEMKERLRQKIEEKISAGDDGAAWLELKEALPGAQISTIHSLCARLLRENPDLAMVDPLFSVLPEDEGKLLLQEAAEESLLALAPQKRGLELLLRVSPKDTVLANLLALYEKLRSEALTPQEVCAQAQREIKERLPHLLQAAQRANELGEELLTFPGTTPKNKAQLASFAAAWKEAAPLRECLLRGDCLDLDGEALKAFLRSGSIVNKSGKLREPVDALQKALEQLGSEVAEQRNAQVISDFCQLVEKLDQLYANRKLELGALDFADLELYAYKLLKDHPDLAQRYRKKFKYLLIDEYQDTSRLQDKLLQNLYRAGENYLFVVGDPKQSIYRFRGAEVAVFGETVERIESAAGEKIELLDNFRTTKTLIDFFNHFFSKLFTGEISYQKLESHRETKLQPELLLTFPEEGAKAEEGRETEAEQIAGRIKKMVQEQELTIETKSGSRPVSWGDIALLFRSTTDLSIYQDALANAGIPHYVLGGGGYYARQEVQDVLNMLRWIENPKDQVALAGILRSPFFSLSDEALFWLTREDSLDASLFTEVPAELSGSDLEGFMEARALLPEFLKMRSLPLDQLIQTILDRTGYKIAIVGDFLGKQKLQNLEKLVQLARRFGQGGLMTPGQLIERVEQFLEQEVREGEAQVESEADDTVKLLTIHKSKGLEFPVVVVPDFSRGIKRSSGIFFICRNGSLALRCNDIDVEKPSRYLELEAEEDRAEFEESKRILYVALTRARDHLIISSRAENPKSGGIAVQTSWLGWLGTIFDVEDWEEVTEPLPYEGGILRITRNVDPAPVMHKEQSAPKTEAEELPLLFNVKVQPDQISPTHPPLSATGFINFVSCPRRYFYTYRWQVDEAALNLLEEEQGVGLAGWQRGQILHMACEKCMPDSDPAALLLAAFKAYGFEPTLTQLEELSAVLKRYQRNELCKRLQNAHSEWQFAVSLGSFILEGFVDKLLLGPIPQVVDFKSNNITSQNVPQLTDYYRLQLEVYAYAVQKIVGAKEVELALHYLVPDETVSWRFNDWQKLEEQLLDLAWQMAQGQAEEDFPANPQSCKYCRFAKYKLCPEALSEEKNSVKIKSS